MRKLFFLLSSLVLVALGGCERAGPNVSFSTDVHPILEKYCLDCHMAGKPGYEASGLDMESYGVLMKGTRFGPVVIAGDRLNSALTMLIEGRADPSIKMPHGDRPGPNAADIEIIGRWVDQGAMNN